MIKTVMAGLGYPEDPDNRQSAVWFPILPVPSYDENKVSDCTSFLIHKNGLPKVLIFPAELSPLYNGLATSNLIFSQPPPYLIAYEVEHLFVSRLEGSRYVFEQEAPTWEQLDDSPSGAYSEERADGEVNAVRESVDQWLRSPYSRKAVERLMSIHNQRAGIVKELIQNACDCFATEIHFNLTDDTLLFRHNGHPFMPANVHAITALNFSCKPPGAIGYKGIGFKSIYQICRRPQISSGPFRFAFEPVAGYADDVSSRSLRPYLPVVDHRIPTAPSGWTEFHFPTESGEGEGIAEAMNELESTLILFVAGRGLPLRKILVQDRVLELKEDPACVDGMVSIMENGNARYWFCARCGRPGNSPTWRGFRPSNSPTPVPNNSPT